MTARDTYSIFVEGVPEPKPRARYSSKGGHFYTPTSADAWVEAIHVAFSGKIASPLKGPVRVSMMFFFPSTGDGWNPHTRKPDVDNLEKLVLDALTKIGAWADDSQVCQTTAEKWFVPKGHKTGVSIVIQNLGYPPLEVD